MTNRVPNHPPVLTMAYLGMTLFVFLGCSKDTAQQSPPAPAETAQSSSPSPSVAPEPTPSLIAEDWVFYTEPTSKKFAFLDPRARVNAADGSISMDVDPALHQVKLVNRNRLGSEFSIDLDVLIETAAPSIATPYTGAANAGQIGFIFETGSPIMMPLSVNAPPGKKAPPINLKFTAKDGQLQIAVSGSPQPYGPFPFTSGGYFVVQRDARAKLKIVRFDVSGDVTEGAFATPELETVAVDNPSHWTVRSSRAGTQGDKATINREEDGVLISANNPTTATCNIEFDGDFYLRAKLSFPGTPPDVIPSTRIKMVSPDGSSMGQARLSLSAGEASYVTVVRSDSFMNIQSDLQSSGRHDVEGPALFSIELTPPLSQVKIHEFQVFADSTKTPQPPQEEARALAGWRVSTSARLYKQQLDANPMSFDDQDPNEIKVATRHATPNIPVTRTIRTDGDFEARWQMQLPALEDIGEPQESIGKVHINLPGGPRRQMPTITLPKPIEGLSSSHLVRVRRKADVVSLYCDGQWVEGPAQQPCQVDIISYGKSEYAIRGYEYGDIQERAPRHVELPGTVGAATLAGGGRYLVMHTTNGKLMIFDTQTESIAAMVDVEGTLMLAGGADAFFTLALETNLITRYHIETLEQQAQEAFDFKDEVVSLSMGSASHGPLVVVTKASNSNAKAIFYDAMQLGTLLAEFSDLRWTRNGSMHASRDGRAFGFGAFDALLMTFNANKIEALATSKGSSVVPGPIGNYVYMGNGPYDFQLKSVLTKADYSPVVPATEGPFHIKLRQVSAKNRTSLLPEIRLLGRPSPLITFPEIQLDQETTRGGIALHHRIVYHPPSGVIVALADTNDRLTIVDADVSQAYQDLYIDDLLTVSQPQTVATPGESYAYELETVTQCPPVTYELISSPPGMSLAPAGVLSWKVPADMKPAEEVVEVLSTNAKGKTHTHRFPIYIDQAESTPTVDAMRTWTDVTGKLKVLAKFIEFKDGTVTVEREDGKLARVKLERLSKADAQYVLDRTGQQD